MSSQGFCAAVPDDHLELLNKNTTDIDYIGMCYRLCSVQWPFLITRHPRARRSSQEDIICIICEVQMAARGVLGVSWVSTPHFVSLALVLRHPSSLIQFTPVVSV